MWHVYAVSLNDSDMSHAYMYTYIFLVVFNSTKLLGSLFVIRSSITRSSRGTHKIYIAAKIVDWPLRNRMKVLVNVILDIAFFVNVFKLASYITKHVNTCRILSTFYDMVILTITWYITYNTETRQWCHLNTALSKTRLIPTHVQTCNHTVYNHSNIRFRSRPYKVVRFSIT